MDLIKFKVTGTVQGVCFRHYTQLEAQKLGLRGWCHNSPDESVEGAAAGPSESIAKFKQFLWHGSSYAKVKDVAVDEMPNASAEAVKAALGENRGFYVTRYRQR